MRFWWLGLSALLVSTSIAHDAVASGNEAAAVAMEGAANALWDQAEAEADPASKRRAFASAAKTYEEAHRLEPRFERIRSAASAWKNAGDDARAAQDLDEALKHSPPPADRDEMERLLAALDQTLGKIDVQGPAGSRVTIADQTYAVPVIVRSAIGNVQVRGVLANGRTEERTIVVRRGQREHVDLGASATLPPPSTPDEPPREGEDGPRATLVAGISLVGVGVAGGIAAGVIAGFGYRADDQAEEEGRGSPAIESAIDLQRASWGVGVPSAVFGITGVVLLVIDSQRSEGRAASFSPCAIGTTFGAGLCGRF